MFFRKSKKLPRAQPSPSTPASAVPPSAKDGGKRGLAVSALVLAVLGFAGFLTTLPAIALGHLAAHLASGRKTSYGGKKLAVAACLIGYFQLILFLAAFGVLTTFFKPQIFNYLEIEGVKSGLASLTSGTIEYAGKNDDPTLTFIMQDVGVDTPEEFKNSVQEKRAKMEERLGREPRPWVLKTKDEIFRFPRPKMLVKFDNRTLVLNYEQETPLDRTRQYLSSKDKRTRWMTRCEINNIETGDVQTLFSEMEEQVKKMGGQCSVLERDDRKGWIVFEFLNWAEPGSILEYTVVLLQKEDRGVRVEEVKIREYQTFQKLMQDIPKTRAKLLREVKRRQRLFETIE